MNDVAKAKFAEIRKILIARGTMPASPELVEAYAEAFAMWRLATDQLAERELIVRSAYNGPAPSPLVGIRDGATRTMETIGKALGLLPGAPVARPMPSFAEYAADVIGDD